MRLIPNIHFPSSPNIQQFSQGIIELVLNRSRGRVKMPFVRHHQFSISTPFQGIFELDSNRPPVGILLRIVRHPINLQYCGYSPLKPHTNPPFELTDAQTTFYSAINDSLFTFRPRCEYRNKKNTHGSVSASILGRANFLSPHLVI